MKKMYSEMILNNFLRKDKDSRKEFYEQFRSLVGPSRPVVCFVGAINKIAHIEMRATKSYGGLTAVLEVIVSHTRKQYLAMQRSDNNPHGNRSTTERVEYFHALHVVFGVNEADNRQVHNFDQLILEHRGNSWWVHISCRINYRLNRHQVIKDEK